MIEDSQVEVRRFARVVLLSNSPETNDLPEIWEWTGRGPGEAAASQGTL